MNKLLTALDINILSSTVLQTKLFSIVISSKIKDCLIVLMFAQVIGNHITLLS